jgi:alpha-D-ribose 1-methylphosphonate 5-triphosphate synthase subunit PhnG
MSFHHSLTVSETGATRAEWMGLLSRAPKELLESALKGHIPPEPTWLRKPETGLMMVKGRVGGTGEPFNLGEITVTRCAIKLHDSQSQERVGVAYVLGRSKSLALLASVADALLQDELKTKEWQDALIQPIKLYLKAQQEHKEQKSQSTKVDFFTLAREAGGQ